MRATVVLLVACAILAGCASTPAPAPSAARPAAPTVVEPARTWPAWTPDACDPNPSALPSHNMPIVGPLRYNGSYLPVRIAAATGLQTSAGRGFPPNATPEVFYELSIPAPAAPPPPPPHVTLRFGSDWPSHDATRAGAQLMDMALHLGYPASAMQAVEPRKSSAGGLALAIPPAKRDTQATPDLVTYEAWLQDKHWVTRIDFQRANEAGARANLTQSQATFIAQEYLGCRLPGTSGGDPRLSTQPYEESLAYKVELGLGYKGHCGDARIYVYVDAVSGAILGDEFPYCI